MHKLRRKLPTIAGLTTFEVAARRLSFTNAAAELHVTQAAVSRQIRALEEQLGAALFHRQHRSIRLTAAGKRFLEAVTLGLDHIASAANSIATVRRTEMVTVSATIAMANFWLMPRLAKFRKAYPDVDVRVLASDSNPDLAAGEVDVAFTCGDAYQPSHDAHFLFTEEIFPVCSPAYLESRPGLKTTENLLGETLLHLDDEHWRRLGWSPINWTTWLERSGIKGAPEQHGLLLNNYPMVIQEALAGHGIALGWRHLVSEHLVSGALVRPVADVVDSQRGYFLVVSVHAPLSKEVAAFRDWILSDIRS